LAFLTALARGVLQDGSPESTLMSAWCSLLVFSAVGCIAGWIGEMTIEQSVSAWVAAELGAQETTGPAKIAGKPS
jgi:hypothetical protein